MLSNTLDIKVGDTIMAHDYAPRTNMSHISYVKGIVIDDNVIRYGNERWIAVRVSNDSGETVCPYHMANRVGEISYVPTDEALGIDAEKHFNNWEGRVTVEEPKPTGGW